MKQILTSFFIASLSIIFFSGVYFFGAEQSGKKEEVLFITDQNEELSSLVCVSNLQLSLDANGLGVLSPDMLLAETFPSYDQFEVSIVTPSGFNDTVDCSLIGETVMAEVLNTNTNQKCWSNITVEDKLAPFFDCDTIDVSCTFDIYYDDIDSLLPNLIDNCTPREDLIVSYSQQQISQNCQSDYVLILDRSWYVEDAYGNSNTCSQIIRLERPAISEVVFPESDTLYCPDENIDPGNTGFPTLNGEEINLLCGLAAWEDDQIIPKCGNTYKVMRTWTVVDWCSNSMRTEIQQIVILDTLGPDFTCPDDITLSNSPNLCNGLYSLPTINASDSCSDNDDISVLFMVDNNWYQEGDVVPLDLGTTPVEVIVTDACNNTSSCDYNVTIVDTESPTVVCGDVEVSLNNFGSASITPFTFIGFSYTDNCFVEEVRIRRMDTNCNNPQDLVFGPSVEFCCADIGEVITVIVEATDSSGLTGSCMFDVDVQDKLPPVLMDCPQNITINCTDLLDEYSVYGEPDISDNCEFTFEYSEDISLDGCKRGEVIRKWVARDSSGNMDSCTQVITVENPNPGFDPNTIQWPEDTVISECNIAPHEIISEVIIPQTTCETVSITFTDMGISPDSACFDFMRIWEVVDSCTGIKYDSVQMIRILNNRPPILTVPQLNGVNFFANENCQLDTQLPAAWANDCNTGVVITNDYTSQGAIVDTVFNLGSTTIVYTAVDSCGNATTAETTINVVDVTPPEVDCPGDTSVSNDPGECGAFIEFPDPVVSDNCSVDSVIVDFTDSTNASGFYPVGITEVSIIIFDVAGLSDTCSFNVEVTDEEAPDLSCSNDTLFLYLDEFCQVEVPSITGLINFPDNCTEEDSIIVSQVPAVGDTLMMVQDTIIQVTVTDSSGNFATCEIVVSTLDTLPPDIMCPHLDTLDVFVDSGCSYVLENFTSDAILMSNCTDTMDIQVTQTPAPGTTLTGSDTVYIITLSAEDLSGNEMECSFPIHLMDEIAPEITCPNDITVSTDPGVCEATVDFTVPLPTDNCGVDTFFNDYNFTEDASDVYPEGTTTVIYTVIDESGNEMTCSFTVTVEDNEAPALDCPQDSMITLDVNCEALIPDVSGWVTYPDNCTDFDSIEFTQSPPADSMIVGVQNIVVIITVTDSSGNSSTCVIDVEFVDETAPDLTCPANIEVPANDTCSYVIENFTSQAMVSDSCSNLSSIIVTQSPPAGETFDGVGTYEITLTATDESDNSTTCTFEVEVIDDTDPLITCPNDITVSTDPGVCEATVDFTVPLPTDNCGVDTFFNDYNFTEDASDVYPEGTTTVIYTVIDESGNEMTCSFTVTVEDNEAPALDCPQDSMITLDVNCEALIPDVSGWVTYPDNCTDFDSIEFTQSPPADSMIVGVQNIVVIITVTDSSGNSSTCVIDVEFVDETAPDLTCPANIEVPANDTCSYVIENFTSQAMVSDSCSNLSSIIVTQSPPAGETFDGVGTYEITLTATDESDNSTTCTFEVEVIDDTDPLITCPNDITVSTDPGVCEATVDFTVPLPTDNCGVDTFFNDYNFSEDASDVYPEGTTEVTYTVEDASGNITMCSFTVTVIDSIVPALECPQDSIFPLDGNCEALIPDVSEWVEYSDNCTEIDSIEFTQSPPADSMVEGAQEIQLIVTVTDSAGNSATCDITLIFTDTLPVSITCPDNTVAFFDENCEYVLPDFRDSATVVSSCTDPDSLTLTQIPGAFTIIDGTGIGDTTVEVTLIVELNGGATDTCMFNVEILDTIPAVLTCASDTSIFVNEDCEGVIPDLTPELLVEDNCINNIGFTAIQDPAAGEIFSAGDTVTISFTVFVDNGDTLTCESELLVLDSIAPGISCPEDTTLILNENCVVSIPDFSGDFVLDPGCADSLDIEIAQSPTPGDYPSFDGDEIEVSLIATNPSNGEADTCIFLITTQDTISPMLQCSANSILIDLDEDCSARIPDVTAEVDSVQDNCTEQQNIIITQSPIADSLIIEPESAIEVEITADDGNGNTVSCFITVEFQDVTPPTLICPPDTMVPCQFDIDSTEQYGTPEASDNCSIVGIVTTTQFFSSNACTIDSLKRTFIATDASGNSTTCVQTVIFEGANPDLTEDDFIFVDTVFTQDCELTDPEDIPGSIPMLDPNLDVCKVINTSFEDGLQRDSDFGCKEFDRTWTLIDSCANLSNTSDGIFTFEQLVVINDTVSPDIAVPFLDTIIYIDSCGTMAEIIFAPASASDCVGIDTLFNDSPFADDNSGGDISGTYEEGIYEITITAEDSCGNVIEQIIDLVVSDTSDLEFSCVFKVEKPFDPVSFMVPFFVSEMADGIVNSCGNIPAGDINFSVDPNDINDTVIIVTCEDFGPGGTEFVDSVPVYAFIDGVLVDSCETIIAITDNVIDCMIEALPGEVVDVNAHPFEDVQVDLSGTNNATTSTNEHGEYLFTELMHGGFYSVECDYDGNPLAGVNTFDLLLIQQHILGLNNLEGPYSLIAADVDKNQRITGGDIIHLRRVILGIDSEMPVDNWRFIPEDYVFISPEWAHASNYPEMIQIESLSGSVMSTDFVGLKVGDVDGSISPEARGRSGNEFWTAKYGADDQIEFFAPTSGKVYGFQFEMPAEFVQNAVLVDGQIKWNDFEIARTNSGGLNVSWSDPYGLDMASDQPLFSLKSVDGSQIKPFAFTQEHIASQVYREGEVQVRSLSLRWSAGITNYALHQNRPNPFMDRTVIPFELPNPEEVELRVHDNSGRLVYSARISGKAGYNEFELQANALKTSGQYHYTLKADNFVGSKILILSKP